jgi:histone H3/H4
MASHVEKENNSTLAAPLIKKKTVTLSQGTKFGSYISEVRNKVLPSVYLSENTVYILSSILEMIADGLVRKSARLVYSNEKETLYAEDLETIFRILSRSRGQVDEVVDYALETIVTYFESRNAPTGDDESAATHVRIMRSQHSQLVMPVSRLESVIRSACSCRVSEYAPVFLAALIEKVCIQILELAHNITQSYDKKIITPLHLSKALKSVELAHIALVLHQLGVHVPNAYTN